MSVVVLLVKFVGGYSVTIRAFPNFRSSITSGCLYIVTTFINEDAVVVDPLRHKPVGIFIASLYYVWSVAISWYCSGHLYAYQHLSIAFPTVVSHRKGLAGSRLRSSSLICCSARRQFRLKFHLCNLSSHHPLLRYFYHHELFRSLFLHEDRLPQFFSQCLYSHPKCPRWKGYPL